MSKLPSVTGEEAVRAFEKADFEVDRVRGSHYILKKAGFRYRLSIPVHKGTTLKPGLLRSQIKLAGLTVNEFVSLL